MFQKMQDLYLLWSMGHTKQVLTIIVKSFENFIISNLRTRYMLFDVNHTSSEQRKCSHKCIKHEAKRKPVGQISNMYRNTDTTFLSGAYSIWCL